MNIGGEGRIHGIDDIREKSETPSVDATREQSWGNRFPGTGAAAGSCIATVGQYLREPLLGGGGPKYRYRLTRLWGRQVGPCDREVVLDSRDIYPLGFSGQRRATVGTA